MRKLLPLVLLTGCTALNPIATAPIESFSDDELCASFNYKSFGLLVGRQALQERNDEIRAEIDRRNLVDDWGPVERSAIRNGMTRCAVLASWGHPNRINRASYGDQFVYCGDSNCIRNQYVYVRRGRVEGWN